MNQRLICLKIDSDGNYIDMIDEQDQFQTFIHGFKLVIVISNRIDHVYIYEGKLKFDSDLVDKFWSHCYHCINSDFIATSDIHLNLFHFLFAKSLCRYTNKLFINGDLLYKVPYDKQSDESKKLTDQIYAEIQLPENLIWIAGNHDMGVPLSLSEEIDVGINHFTIQHGVLPLDNDPRKVRPKELTESNIALFSGSNYLILGHDWKYCMFRHDELIDEYKQANKESLFRVSSDEFKLEKTKVINGPLYLIYGQVGLFKLKLALDLHWKCMKSNIESGCHIICTDNVRSLFTQFNWLKNSLPDHEFKQIMLEWLDM